MPYSISKRNDFLNLTFSKGSSQSITVPTGVYLALCSNDPEEDNGTFNEITAGNCNRVILSRRGQDLPDYLSSVTNGRIYNTKQITFNRATEAYQVKGVGIFESASGGSPIFYASLKDPVDVAINEIFTFDPETFEVKFSDTDVEIVASASAE